MKKIILLFIVLFTYSLNSQLLYQLGNIGQTNGHSITTDKDSNLVIAGTFQGILNCNPKGARYEIESNVGSIDIFFAKYTKTGELLWAKSLGTTGIDNVSDIAVDNSGNVFVAGYFGSENIPGRFIDLDPSSKEDLKYGPGGIDCFLIKLKPNGDYLWGFVLGNISDNSTEIIWDIEVTSSGQIYASGVFAGTVDFNPRGTRNRVTCPKSNHGYFAAKYDKDGKNIWVNSIGANISEPLKEGFSSIAIDGSEGCVIGGNFRGEAKFVPESDVPFPMTSSGETDMFFARYSSSGNIIYRGGFGGKSMDKIYPQCVKVGNDGFIYISGNFLGTSDFYAGSGTVEITNSDNSPDIFLASYLLSGGLRWVIKLDGDDIEDIPKSINFDEYTNIILSGSFSGTTNFDPNALNVLASSGTNGAADAFMAKYDNSGHLSWVKQFGDKLSGKDKNGLYQITSINDIAMDFDDNAIAIGTFFGEIIFGEETAPITLKASNISDLFISKFDYDGNLWYKGGRRPTISVVSPNGGELWNVDSTRIITWYSKNVDYVKIEYTVNNGESWLFLADSISAESSSFTWVVEDNPSELCKVKITSLEDDNLWDVSNRNFIISKEIKASRVTFSIGNPGSVSANAVVSDSKSNFFVAGSFEGTINMDRGIGMRNLNAKGSKDMFIAKYSETGDLIWTFNIGANGLLCEPTCMGIDANDNIYIAGYFGKINSSDALLDFSNETKVDTLRTKGGYDAFIAKYDKDGKYLWAFPIANKSGNTKEIIHDMSIEKNGTIWVTGVYNGNTDFDGSKTEKLISTKSAQPEIFLAKYNSSGNYNWAIGLQTNIKDSDIEGKYSVIADGVGGCYLLGNFRDSSNFNPAGSTKTSLKSTRETDIFLAHYKITSHLDWVINVQGNGMDLANSKSLVITPTSRLIFAGIFKGTADFDPTLTKREFTSFNNTEDMFLAAYSTAGDFRWMQQFPSNTGLDVPKTLIMDNNMDLILTGYFQDDIKVKYADTSRIIQSLGKSGASDIFIFKSTIDGNCIWSKSIGIDTSGNGLLSQSNDIVVDAKNNPIIVGKFFGSKMDFDTDTGIFELNSQGREDAFIAKYFENGNLWIEDVDTAKLNLIRPNGNEVLQANTQEKIIWTSSDIDTIAIEYSLDSGKSWNWITQSTPASSGQYLWSVPDTVSGTCKIHIFDPARPKRTDISFRNFKISDKKLVLKRPNGGEIFFGDSLELITWESKNVSTLNIYFSSDNGKNWNSTVLSKIASEQSHLWKVRNLNSENCLIKIVDRNDTTISDISEYPFTIIRSFHPEIRLISPNGGEIFSKNKYEQIEFYAIDVDSVKIEINYLNGLNPYMVNKNLKIESSITKYNWFLLDEVEVSDSCKIVISSLDDNNVKDISDSFFKIDNNIYVLDKDTDNCLKDISIIPNPAEDFVALQFDYTNSEMLRFEFFTYSGKKINSIVPENISSGINIIKFDIKDFPSGAILIKISSTDSPQNCINYLKFIKN